MGLPAQGLALIIGVDRLLDMVRTCVNVIGNALSPLLSLNGKRFMTKNKVKILRINLKRNLIFSIEHIGSILFRLYVKSD